MTSPTLHDVALFVFAFLAGQLFHFAMHLVEREHAMRRLNEVLTNTERS